MTKKKKKLEKYVVSIPLAGAMHITVEAASAADAKERAWARFNDEGEAASDDIEWELMDCITEGNTSHAPLNEIEVGRVREDTQG